MKMHNKFNVSGENLGYENYVIETKEVDNDAILRFKFTGCADIEYIVDFFGLEKPDIEWYKIYGVKNNERTLLKSST